MTKISSSLISLKNIAVIFGIPDISAIRAYSTYVSQVKYFGTHVEKALLCVSFTLELIVVSVGLIGEQQTGLQSLGTDMLGTWTYVDGVWHKELIGPCSLV